MFITLSLLQTLPFDLKSIEMKQNMKQNVLPQDLIAIRRSYECWKRLHWCRSKINSAFYIVSLMAMFALIATVEFPVPTPEREIDPRLIIATVAASSGLVAVSVSVKAISLFILPHLDTLAEMSVSEAVCGPHDQIFNWIFCACILGHTVAPILFCVDLILISWVKYSRLSKVAPYAVTAILAPMIAVILFFGNIQYQQLSHFKETYLPFPSRRYSQIAEHWEMGSSDSQTSTPSSSNEKSHLLDLESQCFITSYGAVRQTEFIGTPNPVFADFPLH